MVALQLNQIKIVPGQQITLGGINWQDFEAILSELGDKNSSRIAYYQGTLEIRMPFDDLPLPLVYINTIISSFI